MSLSRPRGPRNELHRAAAAGSTAKVKALLASGKININCGDPRGATPLVFAVEEHPCIVQILLDAGADVTIPDDGGAAALHWSAVFGQLCATRMLLEAGANVEATNRNGCTPLQLAGECGHAEVIRALLDAGANVDSRSTLGETALYSAAYLGHVNATKELLRWNANPRLSTVSGNEVAQVIRVPLDVAAQHGHEGVVSELLQLGVDACGAATGDALNLACKRQHLGTMIKLRDAGIVDDGSALLTAVVYREDCATQEKRYRLERLRRLLLRVDAIHAFSWLWPSGARSTASATEAGNAAQPRPQTLTSPSPRRAMESFFAPGSTVVANLLRYADKP